MYICKSSARGRKPKVSFVICTQLVNTKSLLKNLIIILGIFFLISAVFSLVENITKEEKIVSLTELTSEINNGQVEKITVNGNDLEILRKDKSKSLPFTVIF